ncbi:MAG: DUF1254 domain-containing protein [Nibricoccus sp.]
MRSQSIHHHENHTHDSLHQFVYRFHRSQFAQERSPEELQQRAIHRRAVEAVIWGIPAVNYERMLQAAAAHGAKLNQVVYWSRPVNSKNQTLTPNPDTIYFNPFYDTSKGPIVVEIPPVDADHVIVGSFDVSWQNALADVGPAGEDKGKGGKYLILPPATLKRRQTATSCCSRRRIAASSSCVQISRAAATPTSSPPSITASA